MVSEASSVLYDTSVPFGGDLEDDAPPADAKKHSWGASFDFWDDYSNEQAGSDTWE